MKIIKETVKIKSKNQLEFIDITETVRETVEKSGIKNGLATVFSTHTSASIMINHNEPMLIQDMTRILYKLVPIDERYSHDMFELTKERTSDGRSNAHSHCKNMLLGVSANVPIENKELLLGEKQNIFFVELDGSRSRDYIIHLIGE